LSILRSLGEGGLTLSDKPERLVVEEPIEMNMDNAEFSNNYISLQEAIKYCKYSQEYLSLRVRQGKIKGVKLGRNWVTTKEWLEDYLGKIDEYNTEKNGKKEETQIKENVEFLKKEEQGFKVLPPENLPIGQFSDTIQKLFSLPYKKSQAPKFAVLYGLACLVLAINIFVSRSYLLKPYYEVLGFAKSNITKIIGEKNSFFAKNYFDKSKQFAEENLKNSSEKINKKISYALASSKISGVFNNTNIFFKKLGHWLSVKVFALREGLENFAMNIFGKAKTIAKNLFWPKKELAQKTKEEMVLPGVNNGIVAIPSQGEKNEDLKQKIKSNFSDEVAIVPIDDESGIITPIFKERKGSDYLYMLVPVNKK